MPAALPSGGKPGAPPLIPTNPFAYPITYPSAVGTLVLTVNLLPFMTVGTQSLQMPTPMRGAYSDAWLEIINFSDSLLSPIFDTGTGPEAPIPPGYAWAVPIPLSATKLTATVLMQTSTQQFPNELAFVTFFTASDIASGHVPRNGPLVPSVPAGSIGCGTLPACVIVPDAQQVDATHSANTATPQIEANTVTGFSLWDEVGVNNTVAILPTEQDGKARGIALGWVDQFGTPSTTGVPYVETQGQTGAWNIPQGVIELGVAVSGAYPRVYWTPVNPDLMVLSPPAAGANQNGIVAQCWDGAASFNSLSIGPVRLGLAGTWILKDGHVGGVAGQTTAGSFGVPPVVGDPGATVVTVTTSVTILSVNVPAGYYLLLIALNIANTTAANKPLVQTSSGVGIGANDNKAAPTFNAYHFLDGTSCSFGANFGEVNVIPACFQWTGGVFQVTYQTTGTPNDTVRPFLLRLA